MYKALVNDKFSFEIILNNDQAIINDSQKNFDVVLLQQGSFHVLHNNKSYNAEVIEINKTEKQVVLRINGNNYTVAIKDRMDILLQQLGMANINSQKMNDLKAPMPGKVIEILVAPGTVIKKGDPILILEAMKMENILKAAGDATVKEIKVNRGDAVEKNAVLVVMQ